MMVPTYTGILSLSLLVDESSAEADTQSFVTTLPFLFGIHCKANGDKGVGALASGKEMRDEGYTYSSCLGESGRAPECRQSFLSCFYASSLPFLVFSHITTQN